MVEGVSQYFHSLLLHYMAPETIPEHVTKKTYDLMNNATVFSTNVDIFWTKRIRKIITQNKHKILHLILTE